MNRFLVTAAALVGLGLAGGAHAQDWYVRADGGATFQSQVNGTPDAKGKTGWSIDGAVGRSFGHNFRSEVEVLYAEADGKHDDGKLKTTAGLVNGYYDFAPDAQWRPFVGAGVGIGQVKVGGPRHGDDTGFAYQLLAGVEHPINERMSAQVAYRYLGINDVRPYSGAAALNGDYHDQGVIFGVTYKFGR